METQATINDLATIMSNLHHAKMGCRFNKRGATIYIAHAGGRFTVTAPTLEAALPLLESRIASL